MKLAFKEIGNALWKKILRDEMSLETAKNILYKIQDVVKIESHEDLIIDALDVAVRNNVTIYDALL